MQRWRPAAFRTGSAPSRRRCCAWSSRPAWRLRWPGCTRCCTHGCLTKRHQRAHALLIPCGGRLSPRCSRCIPSGSASTFAQARAAEWSLRPGVQHREQTVRPGERGRSALPPGQPPDSLASSPDPAALRSGSSLASHTLEASPNLTNAGHGRIERRPQPSRPGTLPRAIALPGSIRHGVPLKPWRLRFTDLVSAPGSPVAL